MLSREALRREELYGHRQGMVNVLWITGILRTVDRQNRKGYLTRSNNLNKRYPWVLRENDTYLTPDAKEGAQRKIVGRIQGRKNEQGRYTVDIVALDIKKPNIVDAEPETAYRHALRAGIPQDDVRPEVFGEEPVKDPKIIKDLRFTDASNVVKVAGYVQAFNYTPPTVRGDGQSQLAQLEVLIRQTKDADDLIPVVLRGPVAMACGRKIENGEIRPRAPVFVVGTLEVMIKNAGPAGEDGIIPVHTRVVVMTRDVQIADPDDVPADPPWLETIPVATVSRRRKSADVGGASNAPSAANAGSVAVAVEAVPAAIPEDILATMGMRPAGS